MRPSSGCTAQQTQFCITFIQRQPNVFDVGPTLYKYYTNVLCLLGGQAASRRADKTYSLKISTLRHPAMHFHFEMGELKCHDFNYSSIISYNEIISLLWGILFFILF